MSTCGGEASRTYLESSSSISEEEASPCSPFLLPSMKGGIGSSSGTDDREERGEEAPDCGEDIIAALCAGCLPQREGVGDVGGAGRKQQGKIFSPGDNAM